MKTRIILLTTLLFAALSEGADTQPPAGDRTVPLVFTFTTSAEEVIQSNIRSFRAATNKFSVKFQYTEAGSNRVRAFTEKQQNQRVRFTIGEFATPPVLLRNTNTSGRNGFHGISEADANTIVSALRRPTPAGENSPIISPETATNTSPEAIKSAELQGVESAAKDIKAGELRILYFGKPWSNGKPLLDETTGYRVQVVGGCEVGSQFVAEVEGYNKTMRSWHSKTRGTKSPNKQ